MVIGIEKVGVDNIIFRRHVSVAPQDIHSGSMGAVFTVTGGIIVLISTGRRMTGTVDLEEIQHPFAIVGSGIVKNDRHFGNRKILQFGHFGQCRQIFDRNIQFIFGGLSGDPEVDIVTVTECDPAAA